MSQTISISYLQEYYDMAHFLSDICKDDGGNPFFFFYKAQ